MFTLFISVLWTRQRFLLIFVYSKSGGLQHFPPSILYLRWNIFPALTSHQQCLNSAKARIPATTSPLYIYVRTTTQRSELKQKSRNWPSRWVATWDISTPSEYLAQVRAPPLLTQPPANAHLGKQQKAAQVLGSLHPQGDPDWVWSSWIQFDPNLGCSQQTKNKR